MYILAADGITFWYTNNSMLACYISINLKDDRNWPLVGSETLCKHNLWQIIML